MKKKIAVSLLFILISIGIFFIYKTKSVDELLKTQIQKIFNDNKIPLIVKKIKVSGKIQDILQGHIEKSFIELEIINTSYSFTLETSIDYLLSKSSIKIKLDPIFRSRGLPDFQSKLNLDLQFKREGPKILLGAIQIDSELKTSERFKNTISDIDLTLNQLFIQSNLTLDLMKHPVLITANSNISMNDLQIFVNNNTFNISKIKTMANTQLVLSDSPLLIIQGLQISEPIPMALHGGIGADSLNLEIKFKNSMSKLIYEFKKITKSKAFDQITADGFIEINGKLTGNSSEPEFRGQLELLSKTFKIQKALGKHTLILKNFKINTPVAYPLEEFEGELNIDEIDAELFHSKNIHFIIKGIENELQLLLGKLNGSSEPISTPAFGSNILIPKLKIRFPLIPEETGHEKLKLPGISIPLLFSLSISGGPFDITEIQKAFCVLPDTPIKGKIDIEYPKIFNTESAIHLFGLTNTDILGGYVRTRNIRYSWNETTPHIHFSTEWEDIDLHQIGELTHFGDMRGSLFGSLKDADYALTSLGPVPIQYDFTIRGAKRAEKEIRFYGRAVNNILELLGSRKSDMPWYAQFGINMSMKFRNWFPATADYMGFRAKTSGGWTELYTFDPPIEKNHYFLSGTAFKIPLNTHGIYPAIMRTDAFQGWLWGMVDYFRKLSAEKIKEPANESNQCVPFWENIESK